MTRSKFYVSVSLHVILDLKAKWYIIVNTVQVGSARVG